MEQSTHKDDSQWAYGAIARIALQIVRHDSLERLLDEIACTVLEGMGAAAAHVFLIKPDTECPLCAPDGQFPGKPALHRVTSEPSYPQVHHRVALDGRSMSWAARSGETFLCNNVRGLSDAPEASWIPGDGPIAVAACPLLYQGHTAGVLVVLREAPFTEADGARLEVFAAQAAISVANDALSAGAARARADLERQVEERTADYARQTREAETRAREMAALNSASQAMTRSLKVDDIVSEVLQTVLCVTELDAGVIHLEENGRLRTAAVAGLPALGDPPSPPGLDSYLCNALKRGEPIVLSEVDSPEAGACYAAMFGRTVSNAASVPITARGRHLGLLSVASVAPREFTLRDLQMLHAIAQQMGLALDNARLLLAAEERSEMLSLAIQETHHRVKNNLQAISSLLEMRAMQPGDLRDGLRRITGQVRAIALVHDFLSQDADLRGVNVRPVLESLVPIAVSSHTRTDQEIRLVIDVEPLMIPSKEATSLALVATELVANAVEHGLAGRDAGAVTVRLRRRDGTLTLDVEDDGNGIPSDFNPDRDGHLGTELVLRLVRRHLKGSIDFLRQNGTLVRVTLPGVMIL